MSILNLCLCLLAFVTIITQIEFIWMKKDIENTNKENEYLAKVMIELTHKVERVILDEAEDAESLTKFLNEMASPKSNNPYQE